MLAERSMGARRIGGDDRWRDRNRRASTCPRHFPGNAARSFDQQHDLCDRRARSGISSATLGCGERRRRWRAVQFESILREAGGVPDRRPGGLSLHLLRVPRDGVTGDFLQSSSPKNSRQRGAIEARLKAGWAARERERATVDGSLFSRGRFASSSRSRSRRPTWAVRARHPRDRR